VETTSVDKLLENKIALVTGGASGIGRASALALVEEGACVAICDRNEEAGLSVVDEIGALGGEAMFSTMDVAAVESVNASIDEVISRFGRIDCAFNNAGVAGDDRFIADTTDEEWDKIVGINLTGVWSCLRREIQEMQSRGGGSIVNTASVAGLVGWRGGAAYSATKHAVVGLTRSAALEYARHDIRVNAVCPGVIETPMAAGLQKDTSGLRERLLRKHPQGRFGQAEEIAEAVVWLFSDRSSFTNGHTLTIDGGYTAR
jgi:NAD(P)-dependent dehydrogenase (short-subunit alcohol dehydrogenase family)